MNKLQEEGITLEELLARSELLPGNFSVYYNPENILAPVFLDNDKYVDSKGNPVRVRRCSATDFVSVVRSKLLPKKPVQTSIF